jgi:ATP-dependent DNA ligase
MRRILRRGAEGALDHRGHLIVVDRPRSARPGLIQQGIDNGRAQLLTRTGFHWTAKYPSAIAALASVNVKTAYIDGELCGVDEEGLPSFASTQAATDGERDVRLVYYAFDLLHLDGRDVSGLPLIERKALSSPWLRASSAFSSMAMRQVTAN